MKKKQHGFTLIELVVVIILMMAIATGATSLLYQGFNAYLDLQNIMIPQMQAQAAMEVLTRDLRSIRSSSTSDFITATSNSIQFIDIDNRTISYQLASNQLQRQISTLTNSYQTLVGNVTNFTLTYYDATGATTTTKTSVSNIVASLTVTINNIPFTLTTGVYPWNLN